MDDDEDYWNTSVTKSKALSFDDDVLSTQEILAIGKRIGQSSNEVDGMVISSSSLKAPLLPLSSLVSSKVLDLILQAQSGEEPASKDPRCQESTETVQVTLKRLVLGRPYSLHCHRSLKSKTELLDGAVAIGDGNAILSVILFLVESLNKKLVHQLLSSRPSALHHYIGFLQTEGRLAELTDLLTMLGRSPDAAMYQFHHTVRTQGGVDGLLRKLNNVLSNHFDQSGVDLHSTKMLTNYIKFLEWQKCTNLPQLHGKSMLSCLAYCCEHHWTDGAGKIMSPLTLCQQQQITPQQYDWIVLNVHARLKKWDIVESVFNRKDWLGRSSTSSHVPLRCLIAKLSELSAAKRVIALFVNGISNAEERLDVAMQYKIHSVVIETYAKQKDRSALNNYKMGLSPETEEFILAETTLRDPSIKWKN